LPRKDGMTVLRALRAKNDAVPVIITTARDAVADRIAGLNAGADDYVLKPFDFDELVARIRALLRRNAASASPLHMFGAVCLDPVKKTVTLRGAEVNLSPREFAIVEALMQRPGAVLSREKLEESIYGWGEEIGSNAVEVHLHNLRKKLGSDVIKNVRGVGYKISES
jgi:two-component system response regulator QseB